MNVLEGMLSHPSISPPLFRPRDDASFVYPGDPVHPMLPDKAGLYFVCGNSSGDIPDEATAPSSDNNDVSAIIRERSQREAAMVAFMSALHPMEMLSQPTAFGKTGTIMRYHEISNYRSALTALLPDAIPA